MCAQRTTASGTLFERPSNPIGYVAILMALITGVLHLIASTNAIEMSVVLAILFVLNGVGFIGGTILYVTRYWQPWLFIVAAIYAVVTILALFLCKDGAWRPSICRKSKSDRSDYESCRRRSRSLCLSLFQYALVLPPDAVSHNQTVADNGSPTAALIRIAVPDGPAHGWRMCRT